MRRCEPCFINHPARSFPCQNSTSPTCCFPLPNKEFSIAMLAGLFYSDASVLAKLRSNVNVDELQAAT